MKFSRILVLILGLLASSYAQVIVPGAGGTGAVPPVPGRTAVIPSSCSGTDKVRGINSLGVLLCGTDLTGGAGATTFSIDAVNLTAFDPINFQDTTEIDWTNPSAGNIQAALKAGSVLASKLDDGGAAATQALFSGAAGAAGFRAIADADIPDTITLTNITQITNRAIADTTGDLAASRVDDGGVAATQALFSGAGGAAGFRAIADADVPNSITIDLATVATTANAGDAATAFFSSGALELAIGGTNQTSWTASRCVQVNAGGTALESAAAACGAGGSGDSITVATVAATDPDIINSGRIAWTLDTAPTPDTITADIIANSVNATHLDETVAYAFSSATNTFIGASYSSAGDPGDAGPFRLENNVCVSFEASPAATDACIKFSAAELLELGSANATVDASGNVVLAGSLTSGASTSNGSGVFGGTASTTASFVDIFGGDAASNAERPYLRGIGSPAGSAPDVFFFPCSSGTEWGISGTNSAADCTAGEKVVTATTTLALDFSGATLTGPVSAGAAPTANGTIAYDSTANDLEYGDNGTNRKVANLNEAQTFSTKVLDNTNSFSGFTDWTAIAAPATPAASTGRLFFQSSNKMFCGKDDAGVVTCMDAGAGGSTSWSGLTDPTAAINMNSNATGEVETHDFQAAFTTGSQFVIKSSGNPTGGVLFEVQANDTDVGTIATINSTVNSTTQVTALLIDRANPVAAGINDGNLFCSMGASFDADANDREFCGHVDVTSNAGAGQWTWRTRLDGGSFTTLSVMQSDGDVGFNIGANSPLGGLNVSDGSAPESSAIISDTEQSVIRVFGNGQARVLGRDVTNDIEFVMGTSSSGFAVVGSLTAHGLRFRTTNVDRWQIAGGDGHLLPSTDNANDIGAAGNDIQDIFMDGNLSVAGSTVITSGRAANNLAYDVETTGNTFTDVVTTQLDFASCPDGTAFHGWDRAGNGDTAPTPACNDTGSIERPSADFSGSAVNTRERTLKLPIGWTGSIDIRIRYVTVAASPTGNVELDVSTICRAVGESWDGTFNAAQTITDAVGSQNNLNDATQTALTTTGCAAEEDLTIRVSRDGTNDTNNDLAKLLYAEVTLRIAK